MRYALVLILITSGCGNKASGGCPTTDRMQPQDAPCCPNFMDSACDTGLSCAALDSSTPTCVPVHSRADGTACTDDIQCTSGSCNVLAPPIGECRSAPNAPCQANIGCAPVGGKTPVCDMTCHPIGNGTGGSFCGMSSDCNSDSCKMNKCLAALGEVCALDTDCVDGTCQSCGFTNVHCSNTNDTKECLKDCGTDSGGNTIFSRCVSTGDPCSGFADCASSTAQCVDCSAANVTCSDPAHDLNECLHECTSGGFSISC
jgi:hypothetical protein